MFNSALKISWKTSDNSVQITLPRIFRWHKIPTYTKLSISYLAPYSRCVGWSGNVSWHQLHWPISQTHDVNQVSLTPSFVREHFSGRFYGGSSATKCSDPFMLTGETKQSMHSPNRKINGYHSVCITILTVILFVRYSIIYRETLNLRYSSLVGIGFAGDVTDVTIRSRSLDRGR